MLPYKHLICLPNQFVYHSITLFTTFWMHIYMYVFGVYGLLRWLSVKNLPEMQTTWVRSLGQEDPLEKEMATHSSFLEAKTPVLWPPHAKSWLNGKDCDTGRDWGQEEKGTTEDEMAGWHHWLDACKSEWTPGVGDGQGGLAYCYAWGCKESDTTERLNWTELNWTEPVTGSY